MTQSGIPIKENLIWQKSIKDKDLNIPPESPLIGDRYIVGLSPMGNWIGHSNDIAWCNSNSIEIIWSFDIPMGGWLTLVEDEGKNYVYDGTIWKDNLEMMYMSGGANIKQTSIDFGATPLAEKEFTIMDTDISLSSKIFAQVSYLAPIGKDFDELEMDDLQIRCKPGIEEFTIFVRTADGSYLADNFLINYFIG